MRVIQVRALAVETLPSVLLLERSLRNSDVRLRREFAFLQRVHIASVNSIPTMEWVLENLWYLAIPPFAPKKTHSGDSPTPDPASTIEQGTFCPRQIPRPPGWHSRRFGASGWRQPNS